MRALACAALIAASLAAPLRAQVGVSTTAADSQYRSALSRLERGDTTVDVGRLRLLFATTTFYAPYDWASDPQRDSMQSAYERGDWLRVVKIGTSILASEYLLLRTQALVGYALAQLGDSASATWHRAIAGKVAASILSSGAGTADSAYVVISVEEEYDLLASLGYSSGEQAVTVCHSSPCDLLYAMRNGSSERRQFFFDISRLVAYMNRQHSDR